MPEVIPANYELANQQIRSGRWRVDVDLGLIYGVRGQPFRRKNTGGYIQIKFAEPLNNRRVEHAVMAHRVLWESVHGPLSPTLTINHRNGIKTDNRLVNLEAVTIAVNLEHAKATGLWVAQVGEAASNARLTEAQVLAIYRRAWAGGESQRLIGQDYGVGMGAVHSIKQGRAWKQVTGHHRRTP
jgi:hypothetical protein